MSYATAQFEGAAARWLQSIQRRSPHLNWSEFCQLLQNRFGRNQHQNLLRKMFRIGQTGSVEKYVEQFAELYDQLTAYEDNPDTLHYTTRFIDGLKPGVRMAIAMQKPHDLDTAYELALLHEELEESTGFLAQGSSKRQGNHVNSSTLKSRISDDRRTSDIPRQSTTDEKWSSLRNYRKAKGLCFICGEKWSKDHQCKSTVQLHIVQELIDQLQGPSTNSPDNSDSDSDNLMLISAAACDKGSVAMSFKLAVQMQGTDMQFLVDSGSTHSFLNVKCSPFSIMSKQLSKSLFQWLVGASCSVTNK